MLNHQKTLNERIFDYFAMLGFVCLIDNQIFTHEKNQIFGFVHLLFLTKKSFLSCKY
jgi:hypothetical protein